MVVVLFKASQLFDEQEMKHHFGAPKSNAARGSANFAHSSLGLVKLNNHDRMFAGAAPAAPAA
jgi:hypothetical protein